MTVPVLLQFISTVYKWYQIDKRDTKKWSWISVLPQCWPQFKTLRVINLLYKDDPKAIEKKEKIMREISLTEPYLEAWASVLILVFYPQHGRTWKRSIKM